MSNKMLCIFRIYIATQVKKVKVKLTIQQAMKAHRGSRGVVLTLSLTSALDGGVERHALPQIKPVANVQEAGWAQ